MASITRRTLGGLALATPALAQPARPIIIIVPFPPGGSTDVTARHPDDFLLDQLDLLPSLALSVLRGQAADMAMPPSDLAGVLSRLERCGVPNFAEAVRRLAPEDA